MIAHTKRRSRKLSRQAQQKFLSMLPKIEEQASRGCCGEDPEQREEFIAEVVANAFVTFVRLAEQGRLDIVHPTPLARFAIRQVRAGRKVGTKLNVRDITSPYCQAVKGVTVERLDVPDEADGGWQQVLVEDKHATPADVAATRIDFAAWLRSLSRKKRQVATILASGETTGTAARQVKVSPGRISQIRGELREAWLVFQGELVPA